ncbi:MAG: endonuclease/exonuclease/phosphatase family protein, partial [Marmoricola sp.]
MKRKFTLQVLGVLTGAVLAGSMPVQPLAVGASRSTRHDVRVGSFNVVGVNADSKARGNQKTWARRRSTVVSQILGEKLDVLGVQEVNQSSIYKRHLHYGITQYLDLRGALNAKGGHYALTNTNAYNCARPTSTYRCVARDMGSSGDNRILYNTRTVTMLKQGAVTYSTHAAGHPNRYLAWAILKMKATGKSFFFTNTHLDPYSIRARRKQWDQMISRINSLHRRLPVIAVGDFNTSKFSDYADTYIPRMKSNGYGDVLNQVPNRNTLTRRRAEATRRAWVGSFNGFRRNAADFGYEDDRHKIGNSIDWIFATNRLRVKAWEVVVNIYTRSLNVKGT